MSIKTVGSQCCGCRACVQSCKLNAIRMTTDQYGFEYPAIQADLCVDCGACEAVCPAIHHDKRESSGFDCGMAYAADGQTRFSGSSGGLFGIFAQRTISMGGVVFGAAFDEQLKLKTQRADTYEELEPLYKSKYLLCDTNWQFGAIENALKEGRPVLYCSSPCQIAALKLYLKVDYDNLLTIDFICHGVGSQTLFDRSVAYTEKKENIKIKKLVLRYKKANASSHYYYYYYYLRDGKYYEKSDLYFSFPYYYAYCKRLACRDCCYDCKYASRQRVGDITIGDFHTIEKYVPNIDRFAGVSMFLVNTEKGKRWFDAVSDQLRYEPVDREILYQNNRFSEGEAIPPELPAFRRSIAGDPFETTVRKFLKPSRDWIKLIYYHSPKFVRKLAIKLR